MLSTSVSFSQPHIVKVQRQHWIKMAFIYLLTTEWSPWGDPVVDRMLKSDYLLLKPLVRNWERLYWKSVRTGKLSLLMAPPVSLQHLFNSFIPTVPCLEHITGFVSLFQLLILASCWIVTWTSKEEVVECLPRLFLWGGHRLQAWEGFLHLCMWCSKKSLGIYGLKSCTLQAQGQY